MARIIPPGFADVRVVLRASGDPDAWNVTFGVDLSDAGADYEAVGTNIIEAFDNRFMVNMASIVTFVGVDLIIGQDGGEPLIYSVPSGATGAGASGYLPQNCALLIQKRTASGGRRNRGRMYLPLILPEAQVDNIGVITGSTVTAFQTTATGFLSDLQTPTPFPAAPSPMVILHSEGSSSVPAPTPVTSLSVQPVIATQRRRLR